jgi:hypothetical protein
MTREQLDKFIAERPQLTLTGISKEAGKSVHALAKSIPSEGSISPKVMEWLLPVIKKYGYKSKSTKQ